MTYRRDLLDIRAVVRPSTRQELGAEAPRHGAGELVHIGQLGAHAPASMGHGGVLSAPRPTRDAAPTHAGASLPDIVSGETNEVILVKTGFKHVATRVREILFVEAARNYVRIHLETGVVLKSRVPIDRLASHLGSERFLRIHRGRLVNVEGVRSVSALTGGRLLLTMTDGSKVIAARDRRRMVLAELGATTAPGRGLRRA